MKNKWRKGVQVAALPYRLRLDLSPEILLVTSRHTRRWVLPKGWPMKGLSHAEAAAQEAYEEAGLAGEIGSLLLGTYQYGKRRMNGRIHLCTVNVFALSVQSEADHWPEEKEREKLWTSLEEAAALVHESDLSALLRSLTLQVGAPGAEITISSVA